MNDNNKSPSENPLIVKDSKALSRPLWWFRELLAALMWSFVFIQLLILDIGGMITSRSRSIEVIFQYRFLVLLGAISVLWLLLGNHRFARFIGYVIAYPFIIVLWHIPKLIFRNWAVVIAFSPAIYSIGKRFKQNFIFFSIAVISGFVICLAPNKLLIELCMILLAGYLLFHFFHRVRMGFSSSTVFADVSGVVQKLWEQIQTSDAFKPPTGCDPTSDEYKNKFGQSLLQLYAMISGLYFFSKKLGEVIKSRKLDLYFLASLIYTFVLTLVVFAIEYYGLERVYPGSFSGTTNFGLLDFLGYSFSTLMTSDVSPVKPISGFAQFISYLQLFGSLIIIVLLVFLILTSIRERYKQDLDGVVSELGKASERMSALLEENYEITIGAAEALLQKYNPVLTEWLFRLHHGEEQTKKLLEKLKGQSDRPIF